MDPLSLSILLVERPLGFVLDNLPRDVCIETTLEAGEQKKGMFAIVHE